MQKNQRLDRKFFRQEVVVLAKALIGKIMVSNVGGEEVRAYKAPLDRACHAFGGKKTERTKYFWLDGGHFYIYTIYSPKNVCLNITAGFQGEPEAVLIRAVQPLTGLKVVQKRRGISSSKVHDLTNGPGKVGQALGIQKQAMNGHDLTEGQICWLQEDPNWKKEIGESPRINIDYAKEWIDKPWRFFEVGNKFVSKVPNPKSKKQKEQKQQLQKSPLGKAFSKSKEKKT